MPGTEKQWLYRSFFNLKQFNKENKKINANSVDRTQDLQIT